MSRGILYRVENRQYNIWLSPQINLACVLIFFVICACSLKAGMPLEGAERGHDDGIDVVLEWINDVG